LGGIPSRLDQREALALAARAQKQEAREEDFMITFTRRSLALLPALAPLLSPALARAAELNPAAVAFKLPD
jgi:hypothetical protein